MKSMQSTFYVVVGTREEVGQFSIDESSFHKNCVIAFSTREKAKKYIASQKLSKPKREAWSGAAYYRNGYYNLEIEEIEFKS
jgi:hypothetical protein